MENIKQIIFIRVALIMSFIFGSFTLVFSQNEIRTEPSGFLILIETNNNGIKLTSLEGCAWKELTFTINQDKPQAIDQFGMATSNRDDPGKDKDLSDFRFIIKKTQKGINLSGKEGTAWTTLTFNCPDKKCHQYIDYSGMVSKDQAFVPLQQNRD